MSGSPDNDHNPFDGSNAPVRKPRDPFDGQVKDKDDPFATPPAEDDEEISENEEGTSDA